MAEAPYRRCAGVVLSWAMALSMASAARAGDVWVSSGVGGSSETLHTYSGVTYAPFGALDESGWRVRAWAKAFQFSYDTTVAPGRSVEIFANGLGLEAETGWHFSGRKLDITGLFGIVWRDYVLSRTDPSSGLTRAKMGASLDVSGTYKLDENWRISAGLRYVTGFDELWAELKPEFLLENGLTAGLSASSSLGDDYQIVRGALTVGNYAHDFKWLGKLYFSGEAGYEYSINTGKGGPFGALHMGFNY